MLFRSGWLRVDYDPVLNILLLFFLNLHYIPYALFYLLSCDISTLWTITFDYHYGRESSQYHYYQIPQILIKDCYFKNLSTDAKLLYGIMLNRMKLSQKKGWLDDESRVFIYFTVEEVKEELNCGKNKAINLLAELDVKKGFGLIERKRQGMGKPDVIYVRHFARAISETGGDNADEDFPEHEEDDSSEDTEDCDSDSSDEFFPGFENQTSRGLESKPQEVWKVNLRKFRNQTSGGIYRRLSFSSRKTNQTSFLAVKASVRLC